MGGNDILLLWLLLLWLLLLLLLVVDVGAVQRGPVFSDTSCNGCFRVLTTCINLLGAHAFLWINRLKLTSRRLIFSLVKGPIDDKIC